MPYTISNPPSKIKELSDPEKRVWINTFNSVFESSGGNEAYAHKAAWAAVRKYRQSHASSEAFEDIYKERGEPI